jgi:hypothetical protein
MRLDTDTAYRKARETELRQERDYRFHERLNILCPVGTPNQAAVEMANKEADTWFNNAMAEAFGGQRGLWEVAA